MVSGTRVYSIRNYSAVWFSHLIYLVHLTQVSLIVITELCSPFFLGPKIKIGALEIQSKKCFRFLGKGGSKDSYLENRGD